MCLSYGIFALFTIFAWRYPTVIYLLYQGKGQLSVLMNRQSLQEYKTSHQLTAHELENLQLIGKVKAYSVDSLGYLSTNNFTQIYHQDQKPVLWVITASEPFELKAYEWEFPLVGKVTYKGFFRKDLAEKERNHLRAMNYDVDMRPVSAWSTLGWFNDPILSSMLKRSRASISNLLFHELFHATYYAPSSVNLNENMANFIAHKATLQFLRNDSAALEDYLRSNHDRDLINAFMRRQNVFLKSYYREIKNQPNRQILKLKAIHQICDSLMLLPLKNKKRAITQREEILTQKNACFIDYAQYDSMQDSLENVFNKIYRGELKKMVWDLKQNQTIANFGN